MNKLPYKLYAGLDIDTVAKIYILGADGQLHLITDSQWREVLDAMGCEPGERPLVELVKDPEQQ